MSEQNKNVDMNIPTNQQDQPAGQQPPPQDPSPQMPEQPQPQPAQPTTPGADVPTTNIHSKEKTKMTFLLALTFVLGLVAVASLIFALKTGGNPFNINLNNMIPSSQVDMGQEEAGMEQEEETQPTPSDPKQLDPSAEVSELDDLNLEIIEESYLDSILEE